MSNHEYGDLSVILSDESIISEVKEKVRIFLNSYAFFVDRWYEVTGDFLYEVICILKAHNVYEIVDFKIAALKEIILYAITDMVEIKEKKDVSLLKFFVSGLIDSFAKSLAKKQQGENAEIEFAPYYNDFDCSVIDILTDINSFYLADDWRTAKLGTNKYRILLYAIIVSYLIEVISIVDDNTTFEQLCSVFFDTQFMSSVQQDAYEQYGEEFYSVCETIEKDD